jgi:hypothetical protein
MKTDISKNEWERMRELMNETRACFCIGPQPGHEMCPCAERGAQMREAAMIEKLIKAGWTPPRTKK